MQKILIVTDCFEPTINGVVTTLKNIKIQAEKDGYEVLIIEPSLFTNFSSVIYPDVRVSIPIGFDRMIDDFSPDYIHIATESVLGIMALFYCRKRGYNFTTAFHTKWGEFLYSILRIPVSWTNAWLRRFHRDKIVFCTSSSMIEYLTENRIGKKLVSWSRGVDTSIFSSPRVEKSTGKMKLLSVGRVSREKNLDVFCRLDSEKYDLTLVGDGPYLSILRKKYPHVRFTGTLIGRELADIYAVNDVMVFTSKNDTFGIVNIESQMMGTPVAAYDVTGPKDIIVNGVNGCINDDIEEAIRGAYTVDRFHCLEYTRNMYSWEFVWHVFRDNMVRV
jgi:glycosyltransferase involved in cell wall biosynthesis